MHPSPEQEMHPHLNTSRLARCRSAWLLLGSGTYPFCRLHLHGSRARQGNEQVEPLALQRRELLRQVSANHPTTAACPPRAHQRLAATCLLFLRLQTTRLPKGPPPSPDQHLGWSDAQALCHGRHSWVCQLLGLGQWGVGLWEGVGGGLLTGLGRG